MMRIIKHSLTTAKQYSIFLFVFPNAKKWSDYNLNEIRK